MIPDFEKFLAILNQAEVEFVVIGGVAIGGSWFCPSDIRPQ
jgi:hypothetical protein